MTTNTTGSAPADMLEILDDARELGKEYGKNAGSWIGFASIDEATKCIQLSEAGAPEWDDEYGLTDPLSGEFAGDLTPDSLMKELSLADVSDEEQTSICDAFEVAFRDAFVGEVISHAHRYIGD